MFRFATNQFQFCCLILVLGFARLGTAQTLSLPFAETLVFNDTSTVVTRTFDLSSLPNRPIILVEARSDLSVVVDLTLGNYAPDLRPLTCGGGVPSTVTIPEVGFVRLENRIFECDPDGSTYSGITFDVTVQASYFGGETAPVEVDLQVFGVTQPPYGEALVNYSGTTSSETLRFSASKSTSIYEFPPNTSNGAGSSLWVGVDPLQLGPSTLPLDIRSLVSFDLSAIPTSAIIDSATFKVDVLEVRAGGGVVNVFEVESDLSGFGATWPEGEGNLGVTDTFTGEVSATPAATWFDRDSSGVPWSVPGGDTAAYLGGFEVTSASSGIQSFWSPTVTSTVAGMVATGADEDGFLFDMPIQSEQERGVRFAPPDLVVDFSTTEPYQLFDMPDEMLGTGALTFVSEGEDFRWFYDLDQDDILQTEIGGVCTALPGGSSALVPYSYAYGGTPGYVGVDCCMWQIDSPQSGTVGTGQALFFHNLEASDPANYPSDSDSDGIVDGCDNCQYVANGPLLGTCLSGPNQGGTCRSDGECSNGICSLAQEDADQDRTGDACVPEPGFGLMTALGGLVAVAGARGRRIRSGGAA